MYSYKKQGKSWSVSLRTVITMLVSGLVLVVSIALISVIYVEDQKWSEDLAGERIHARAERSIATAREIQQRGALRTSILGKMQIQALDEPGESMQVAQAMRELMRTGDGIFSMFATDDAGSYLEVSNLEAAPGLKEVWGAEPEDRWLVLRVFEENGVQVEQRDFLDVQLNVRERTTSASDYQVTERPWFIEAEVGEIKRLLPYQLSIVEQDGMSYVSKSEEGAVFGTIMLLSVLDNLLKNPYYPETALSVILTEQGDIISQETSPDAWAMDDTDILIEIANTGTEEGYLQEVVLSGREYYSYSRFFDGYGTEGQKEYAVTLIAKEEALSQFQGRIVRSLGVSAVLMFCLLPVALFASRIIVKPMRSLATENEKIRQGHYKYVEHVPSRIRELDSLSESLVAMAGAIQDYIKQQKDLRNSMITMIADAIDNKSHYTGLHCERVPEIAISLAQAACEETRGICRDFSFETEEQWQEFKVAAWMHDCGKITTPEHIIDKSTKLECIYNRIHEIRLRFEVLWRDAEIDYLRQLQQSPERERQLQKQLAQQQSQLSDEFAFVANCNIGDEFFSEERLERLQKIAKRTWVRNFSDRLGLSMTEQQRLKDFESTVPATEFLLSDKAEHVIKQSESVDRFLPFNFTMKPPEDKQNLGEIYNLSIAKGTLTKEDRYIINEHISATIQMLESLPWPEELQRVPEYAGGHHEKMDGTGYPRGLKGHELSIPARIMAIADVFEALTASDRPYKPAKTLSESLQIMAFMVKDNHLDGDLFKLFVAGELYLEFANNNLDASQIDNVDKKSILAGL